MLRSFDKNLIMNGKPVILYGAAMYGELAHNALGELKIPVMAFCDRVQAGKSFCGIKVISPEQLKGYPEANVLICATKGMEGIAHYLHSINHEYCYEISDLLLYVNFETLPPYCKALPVGELIRKYRFYLHENPPQSEKLDLSFVALSITERCTLRCKKCSVLATKYKYPCDDPLETILIPLKRFLDCVDSVAELQIGGGEPFMHKELDKVLSFCLEQKKIKEISIFTNSTILPNERLTEILKNPKFKLLLDDYGNLSRKLPEITRHCKENGIRYLIQNFERWDDLGNFQDKQETEEQLIEKFRYCSFGNVMSFMKGKLYRCTTAARIADLGIVPEDGKDYVDFLQEQEISLWKGQIHDLIFNKKYHLGCKFCNGISTHVMGIPVAEQEE